MLRQTIVILLAMFFVGISHAQVITVTTKDGQQQDATYAKGTIRKKVIILNSGQKLGYEEIAKISTDHYDAYEQAVLRTARGGYKHVEVKFTGDENVYALQLQKLEEKRKNANKVRGAGGIMMLLGILGGSRELTAAGLATYGAGNIKRDINTDKTIAAQNQAIAELQEQQKRQKEAGDLEAQWRREYGDENVDGLIALIEGNHTRALAFANTGETSSDANHRWAAVWLKAIIYADQGNEKAKNQEYKRLVVLDPEIASVEDAAKWMDPLLTDLEDLRQGREPRR